MPGFAAFGDVSALPARVLRIPTAPQRSSAKYGFGYFADVTLPAHCPIRGFKETKPRHLRRFNRIQGNNFYPFLKEFK